MYYSVNSKYKVRDWKTFQMKKLADKGIWHLGSTYNNSYIILYSLLVTFSQMRYVSMSSKSKRITSLQGNMRLITFIQGLYTIGMLYNFGHAIDYAAVVTHYGNKKLKNAKIEFPLDFFRSGRGSKKFINYIRKKELSNNGVDLVDTFFYKLKYKRRRRCRKSSKKRDSLRGET